MIGYRAVGLVTVAFAGLLPAFGQAGPGGDRNVGATEEARSSAYPTVVPAKIGNINEQGAVKYSPGPSDRKAWTLEYKVEDVREMWLKSDKQNVSEVNSVRKSALASADALAGIPDGQLNLGGLIIKDEYACFGYVIAGANTTSKSVQWLLARKAEHFCKAAASQLAKADEPVDSNARAVKDWETHGEEHPRIAYLHAMSKCLEATSSGDGRSEKEAREILSSEIPPYYLERYPAKDDYVLHECVDY
jgi:hypothetical protein